MATGGREREILELVDVQHDVARWLIEGERLDEVAPKVLEAIARVLGWRMAGLWEVPPEGETLRFVTGWDELGSAASEFWQLSRQMNFRAGEGLPGRAWASGELEWIEDLERDPNFPRLIAASRIGMGGGFAVPIPVGRPEDTVAVMDFFVPEFRQPDDELIALMVGFSDQIALFINRRRSEQELHRMEALRSGMLGAMLDCMISIDDHGRVVEFNAAAERTFGYRRSEVLGRELAELIVPDELREAHRQGLRRVVDTGESEILDSRVELVATRSDGERFPVELTVTRIEGADPPLFTGFVRDVSEVHGAADLRRKLGAVVESTSDAVMSLDVSGAVTAWNPGAAGIYGYQPDDAIGRHVSFLVPEDRGADLDKLVSALTSGEGVEQWESEHLRADGARIEVTLSISPIRDPLGERQGVAVIARDITADRRTRRARDFLARAGAALDASLDPVETMRTVAETAVPELAELCIIDLVRADGGLGDSVAACIDPAIASELEEIRARWPLDPAGSHPVAQVIRSGRSMVLRDLQDPAVVAQVSQSDVHRRLVYDAGYRSAAVAPLVARGQTIGAISLLHVRSDLRYDPSDLELIDDLAARAALALDNARLYAQQTRIVEDLERSLRPDIPPSVPWAEIAATSIAGGAATAVGGDFYDFVETPQGWLVFAGDVAGKGSEAAALTAIVRHGIRAVAPERSLPSEMLRAVNAVMLGHDLGGRFATAIVGRIRSDESPVRLTISSAGHPPALLSRSDGTVEPVGGQGFMLGVEAEPSFVDQETTIEPGATLLLYTDGLLEAGPPAEHIWVDELAQMLGELQGEAPEEIVTRLRDSAISRSSGELRDDVVIIAIRFSG